MADSFQAMQMQEAPYLNSNEFAMLVAINPKYQDRYETQRDIVEEEQNAVASEMSDPMDARRPNSGAMAKLLDMRENYDEGAGANKVNGSGVEGGFLQALLPFLPLIGQVAQPIINGIAGLFRGRGVDGAGVISDYFKQNEGKMKELEGSIKRMKPKAAWLSIMNWSKSMAHDIISKSGVASPQFANTLSDEVVGKVFPNHLRRIIAKSAEKAEGSGKVAPSNYKLTNRTMALPLIKYGLDKMVGSGAKSALIYKQLKSKMMEGSGFDGGKLSWEGVKNFFRKALKFAMPIISSVMGNPVAQDAMKSGISGLAGKIPMFANNAGTIGDVGTKVLTGLANPALYGNKGGMLRAPNSNRGGMIKPPNAGMISPPNGGIKKNANSGFKLKIL